MTSVSERIARRVAQRNAWSTYTEKKLSDVFKMLRGYKPENVIPSTQWLDENLPVKEMDWEQIRSPKSPDIIQSTWIGHASVLFQVGDFNIITDPVFSERCSALQFIGPKRYRPPACTVNELMVKEEIGIDIVLISHNHYDHLDYNSVKKIANVALESKNPTEFVVPLGLLSWFKRYVPESLRGGNKVTELDWHDLYDVVREKEDGGKATLRITPVPMQHWTNRYGYDRDKSLWCGFSVEVLFPSGNGKGQKLLFTGDTGWFDEAVEIGKQYGPFDVAAIPIGAYEPRWFMKQEHLNPEDAVRFMDAVQAKMAIPIHWGTFPL